MANSYLDNCGFAPTAGGTTDWTFSATVAGYQNPTNAGAGNGLSYVVRSHSSDLSQWEYSVGAYNSGTGTFARTTVLYNSAGTGTKQSGAGTKINFTNPPSLVAVVHLAEDLSRNYTQEPCGRLTTAPGVAETSTNQTAITTLYYTPNARRGGNIITLWDSAIWLPIVFAETSLSLAGLAANTLHDVWGRINSGALALDVTAWTNDTTRATAIAQQDGIDVKSGDATRRFLGTFRTTGTVGQTEDSNSKRYVSNRYNEIPRPMLVNDPAGTWPAGTSTFRQANNNAANQADCVMCVPRLVQILVLGNAYLSTVGAASLANVGIGVSSVPVASADIIHDTAGLSSGVGVGTSAYYVGTPGAGRYYFTWIEASTAGGGSVVGWQGTNLPFCLSGILGMVNG